MTGDAAVCVVERLPFGATAFQLCTADVFQPDELTVSYADPIYDEANGPARVFPPGTWAYATVKDANDNILFHFASKQAQDDARERCRQARAFLQQRTA